MSDSEDDYNEEWQENSSDSEDSDEDWDEESDEDRDQQHERPAPLGKGKPQTTRRESAQSPADPSPFPDSGRLAVTAQTAFSEPRSGGWASIRPP